MLICEQHSNSSVEKVSQLCIQDTWLVFLFVTHTHSPNLLASFLYVCICLCVCVACRLVLAQNKKDLLTNWWNEGKLEASEELGDMVSAAGDKDMALKIYQLCNASGKVRGGNGGWLLGQLSCPHAPFVAGERDGFGAA